MARLPLRPRRLSVVLTPDEVRAVLAHLRGPHWLVGNLLYEAGLRLMESLRLRVKDLDFDYRQLVVRDGKGSCAPQASTMVALIPAAGPRGLHAPQ